MEICTKQDQEAQGKRKKLAKQQLDVNDERMVAQIDAEAKLGGERQNIQTSLQDMNVCIQKASAAVHALEEQRRDAYHWWKNYQMQKAAHLIEDVHYLNLSSEEKKKRAKDYVKKISDFILELNESFRFT